jgi:hypothetical protein
MDAVHGGGFVDDWWLGQARFPLDGDGRRRRALCLGS